MPFSSTASVTSTDMNNMLRGLYRDNADHAVTGTTAETDMGSVSVVGGTIGATGCLLLYVSGQITGVAGAKTIRIYFGGTLLGTITRSAALTYDWGIEFYLVNTASNAQRSFIIFSTADASTMSYSQGSTSIDTSQTQILKVTAQCGNAGDTITEKMFDAFVCQIT